MGKTESPIKVKTILERGMFRYRGTLYRLNHSQTMAENANHGYKMTGSTILLVGETEDGSTEETVLSTHCVAPHPMDKMAPKQGEAPVDEPPKAEKQKKVVKESKKESKKAPVKPAKKKK